MARGRRRSVGGAPRRRDGTPIRYRERRRYEELREYLDELAEAADVDASDLWDMYYGYAPGSHAGEL